MDIKSKLKLYLDSYLKPKDTGLFKRARFGAVSECCEASISTFINENKDEDTFQTKLFKLIDERELKDSDVYNKVNIDRRLFSKIRSNKDYHPSKETIILFGLALELEENEIVDLLSSASYSLPMNTTFDLIIRFCFKEHIYNIDTVNEFLYDYGYNTL
jgi:hypothetical protein